MKSKYYIVLILLPVILVAACKTKQKVSSRVQVKDEAPNVAVSNITLYDQPLDTIKKYIVGQRWQLIYSTGGITGKDQHYFPDTYYTLTRAGKLVTENGGQKREDPYAWQNTRDIFTGNNIYVVSGTVQWKVEGIFQDTLRLSDNYVDGYGYALIRNK